ncbi:MAG: hypothetical protein H8E83_05375 [Planctomycetes bacterium]|nr:hypothetical protein [Planctomycetota bacterium]
MNRTQLVLTCAISSIMTSTCMATMLYTQSFENDAWLGEEYFDYGNASADHWLKNNNGQASVNGDGFNAWYENTGSVGLTDGDFVGVTNSLRDTGGMFHGSNAYKMSDTDGIMRLIFDDFGKEANVSLAVFIANTGYENTDALSITYGNDVLLSLGDGSDGGFALENAAGSWLFIEGVNVSGQLSINFNSNSSAESIYIDSISISRVVPSPGALALIGLAGLTARRRRDIR